MRSRSLVPLAGAILLFSCQVEEVLDVDPVSSVELSAPYPAISPGEVHHLALTLRDSDGSDLGPRSTIWESLDPSIATVDERGQVTGVAVGIARVIARSDGRADTIELPVKATWKGVWAGNRLVCAERIAGGTFCWGDTPGDGTTETRLSPVPIGSGLTAVQRTSGVGCALDGSSHLKCWSPSEVTSTYYGNGSDTTAGPTPRLAASGLTLRAFSQSPYNMCGVGQDGTGWCWGSFIRFGVDTISSSSNRTAPDTVLGGVQWRVLLPEYDATCGLSTAGQALCFGGSTSQYCGECAPLLGLGDTVHFAKLPTPVVDAPTFDSLWVSSSATACGLTSAGEAYCWGRGVPRAGGGMARTATRRFSGITFKTLSLYQADGCGVKDDGTLWCWTYDTPGAVVKGTLRFSGVAVGEGRICALTAGGGLYCKGNTLIGDGRREPSDEFVRVTDPE